MSEAHSDKSNTDTEIKGIKVTVSTNYEGPEQPVIVNAAKPLKLSTKNFDVYVYVRIRDFKAVVDAAADATLDYFETDLHKTDNFAIQFTVVFKKDVNGKQLVWGNDWDTPIRDILPWGFSAAFKTFKYAIDPGVEGDPYADKPWIYGAVLSSINYMQKVDGETDLESFKGPVEEPEHKSRSKKYLNKDELNDFTFRKGETYAFDFSSPYLDMSTSPKIKLPGFTFDVGKYAGMTKLRYVLKSDEELIFAVTFDAQN